LWRHAWQTGNRTSSSSAAAAGLKKLGTDAARAGSVKAHARLEDIAWKDVDLVIEAATEDLALKQKLFAQIEALARPDIPLTSNTSNFPIGEIGKSLKKRNRIAGTHFFMPAHLVPLVEVVSCESTDAKIAEGLCTLMKDLGKAPIWVKKDVPGFVGNRLQHALWREAIALVEHGICDAETVDAVIKASFGRRLAVLGPLENADLVGTDLTLAIHQTVLPDIESRPGPSPYLEKLVEDKRLGFKSGEGFRKWSAAEQAALRSKVLQHLKNARAQDT
jgi:3-hydroxybutyryl-CoA dehydrogenase